MRCDDVSLKSAHMSSSLDSSLLSTTTTKRTRKMGRLSNEHHHHPFTHNGRDFGAAVHPGARLRAQARHPPKQRHNLRKCVRHSPLFSACARTPGGSIMHNAMHRPLTLCPFCGCLGHHKTGRGHRQRHRRAAEPPPVCGPSSYGFHINLDDGADDDRGRRGGVLREQGAQ